MIPRPKPMPGFCMRPVVVADDARSPVLAMHTADGSWSLETLFAETFDPGRESRREFDARARNRADVWEDWLASKDADREGPDGRII
jgi:hypothetical protein